MPMIQVPLEFGDLLPSANVKLLERKCKNLHESTACCLSCFPVAVNHLPNASKKGRLDGQVISVLVVEVIGLVAIIVMVVSYTLEKRHTVFIATFAAGCALAALYAFLIGSLPFLIAEGLWSAVATKRWIDARPKPEEGQTAGGSN